MKIGFISYSNITDKSALSGTPYSMAESLRNLGHEVVWIQPNLNLFSRCVVKITNMLFGFNNHCNPFYSFGINVDYEVLKNVDIIFAPFVSDVIAKLKTDKKIIYLSDTTFHNMDGYYWKGFNSVAKYFGNSIEQKAISRSEKVIMSSEWAANSAVNFYHKSSNQVEVIEFGSNVDENFVRHQKKVYKGNIDILFVGVDWERKGGDVAVETCQWLNDHGIVSKLHVVGIPQLSSGILSKSFVVNYGRLNKNIPEQYEKLCFLYTNCHIFLLPTHAECSAIVFGEASAYSLPSFSYKTGGLEQYVKDGVNGYLLPLESSGEDFGRIIKRCVENGMLERMERSSYEFYLSTLNWKCWARKVSALLNDAYY